MSDSEDDSSGLDCALDHSYYPAVASTVDAARDGATNGKGNVTAGVSAKRLQGYLYFKCMLKSGSVWRAGASKSAVFFRSFV